MIEVILLLTAGILGTISILTYIAKWIAKDEDEKSNREQPLEVTATRQPLDRQRDTIDAV